MKMRIPPLFLFCALFLLAACGETPAAVETSTAAPSLTPDPCSTENLPGKVAEINKLMREFDDYSALASNTPQTQLVLVIPELQRILREAEDQSVPACLQHLKTLQIDHMTVVVQTLMAFMSSSDAGVVNSGIAVARDLHGQYDVELARLLGVTLAVVTPSSASLATPEAGATDSPTTAAPSAAVTNPGPNEVNLRNAPDLNAAQVGVLGAQVSTLALGRTENDEWLLVEIPGQPGQTAWVYAPLVQLSVPMEGLPVVSP
jgi:hypothetical protein